MAQDNTNLLVFTQKIDTNAPIMGFFHEWTRAFSQYFDHVHVVCLEKGEHDLPDNVSVYSLGKEEGESRLKYIKNFYRYIFSLWNEYDSVLVHMNQEYLYLGGLFWRLWGKKVLWWKAHGHLSWDAKLATVIPQEILTSSEEGFRFDTEKKHIIGQGIDTQRFSPAGRSESDALELLSVGRIAQVKHIEELAYAVEKLKDRGVTVHAQVAGPVKDKDRAYAKQLKQMIHEHGLAGDIDFLDSVPQADMPDLYRDSDILVNTSDTDSLDKVVFEAMAAGTIPVTSNNAFKPVLSDYGLWVPKRNVDKLTWAILRVDSMEPDEKDDLKDELRNVVIENHSLDHLAQQVYEYAQQ